VGEIRLFACSFAVAGWAFCDGALMPISENEVLFQLIGTTYGGDGQETFALPDLRGRLPLHQGQGSGLQARTIGETAGTEEVTLTTNQIPSHNHAFYATTGLANQPTPGGNTVAQSGTLQLFTEDTPAVALAAQAVGPVGGTQPHTNFHPYLAISFQISLFGDFPSPT
jgi:microcystin-dependent protein